MTIVQDSIIEKLNIELRPAHLEVTNESSMHNVPTGSESHFKVVVATERFAGMRRLARHRLVNGILAQELAGTIHALALHTMTPDEYFEAAGAVPNSPDCHGGEKLSG
jgi:BolA protein